MEVVEEDDTCGSWIDIGAVNESSNPNTTSEEPSQHDRKMSDKKQARKRGLTTDSSPEETYNILTINEDVKITEFAPSIFNAIRKMDNITSAMIEESLSTEANAQQLFKASESKGRSGSFMFFSFDKRFMIKTMDESEKKIFLTALPSYLDHFRKNRNSIIVRNYGMYCIEMEDLAPVYILLQDNLWQHVTNKQSEYDLKGSIIHRHTEGGRFGMDLLKDVNFRELAREKKFLKFMKPDMRLILHNALRDITFLSSFNLMDYSLFMIIETNPDFSSQKDEKNRRSMNQSRTKKEAQDEDLLKIKPADFLTNLSKKMPSKITEVSADLETERKYTTNTESNQTELIKTNEGQTSDIFANYISKNHDQYLESLV